jgi:type VI secretion system protein ImpH
MAGPDWEEADSVEDGGDGIGPVDPHADAAPPPDAAEFASYAVDAATPAPIVDEYAPIWTEDAFSPSPGARGEDGGAGAFSAMGGPPMFSPPDEMQDMGEPPMAPVGTSATTPDRAAELASIFTRLASDPYSFDFYQAVRRIEAERPDLPPVGHSLRPSQDAVRFCQEPSLAFAPSTVWDFRPAADGSPARLFVNFLGMLGPNGPLPLHLTDYARDRERNHADPSMARFLDLFNHRILSLFYRAWAASSQAVSFERGTRANPNDAAAADRFGVYYASLFGLGMTSLRNRDAVHDAAKLHFAGRLANETRNAEGLRSIVQSFFGIDADIEEFVGRWIDIPEPYRCRLGESRETGTLGLTAIVGSRSWDCQQKFRIRLGPMSLADYQRMLPGGDSIRRLVAWVRTYTCDEFDWDVRLILKSAEVPPVRLGGMGQLGWTTWLNTKPPAKDAEDLVLHPAA